MTPGKAEKRICLLRFTPAREYRNESGNWRNDKERLIDLYPQGKKRKEGITKERRKKTEGVKKKNLGGKSGVGAS